MRNHDAASGTTGCGIDGPPPDGSGRARQLLPDLLAAQLRRMIANSELPVGGRVAVQALSTHLGVSRYTMREAIKLLTAEGMLSLRRSHGAVVGPLTYQAIDQLTPIVGAFEALAGQIACDRIGNAAIATMEMLYAQLAHHYRRRNESHYMRTADAILKVIFAAAGNESLLRSHEALLMRLRWPVVANKAPPEWDKAMEEQQQMLHAIRFRSADLWSFGATRHARHRTASLNRYIEMSRRQGLPGRVAKPTCGAWLQHGS